MNYYIANFSQLSKLDENCIPISTCSIDPYFFHQKALSKSYYMTEGYYVNDNNVLLGIREPILSPSGLSSDAICKKHCQYKERVPDCPFLIAYRKYLSKLDFQNLLAELERVSEEVRTGTAMPLSTSFRECMMLLTVRDLQLLCLRGWNL